MYQSVKFALLLPVLASIPLVLGGCATLQWYGQAARGQFELLAKRQDIERLLAGTELSEEHRRKLELALDVRDFASRSLALPDNASYRSYVDLDRDAVVWNVIAAPEFAIEPKTWCYPFVGCLAYRGWFRREAAERQAARLADRGLDVRVSPVVAYSTLGRFSDPVTSPMLAQGEVRLAGLILHELAHQRLFVAGDTRFNEAFATAVEREGLDRWLAARGLDEQRAELAADRRIGAAFVALLLEARRDLGALYAEPLAPDAMRDAKRHRLQRLADDYKAFASAHATRRFDGWMARGPNNADLALIAAYEDGARAFGALLAEYDGDFERFFDAVRDLADRPAEARDAFLNSCRTTACP